MDQTTPAARTQLTSTPSAAPGDAPAKAVTPFHSTGCALVIGIDDYRVFDPSGQSDLKGSAQDTVAIARCCSVLGMNTGDIHILRDDVESPGDPTGPAPLGKTTQAGIHAELDWLREQLDAGRKGLLWYSGHGAHTDRDGLLLCPSDTTTMFANTIPFKELAARLGPSATKNLTVVLDCCHGGPAVDKLGRRSSTLGGDPIKEGSLDDDMKIGAVVLAACAPGQQTQQSWFSALPHGAFSWALLSTANQWQARQQGGNVRLDLDYATLMKKASELLAVLDFEGKPQLYGPPGVDVGKLAALQMGNEAVATSDAPDAKRPHVQTTPDWIPSNWTVTYPGNPPPDWVLYTFFRDTTQIGAVLAVNNPGRAQGSAYSGTGYAGGTEYWQLPAASLTGTISVKATAGLWFDPVTLRATPPSFPVAGITAPIYTMSTGVSWPSLGASAPNPTSAVWCAYTSGSGKVTFGLTITASTPPTWTWVQEGSSASPYVINPPAINNGDLALTLTSTMPSLPAKPSWYEAAPNGASSPTPLTGVTPTFSTQAPIASVALTSQPTAVPVSMATLGSTLYMAIETPSGATTLLQSADGCDWSRTSTSSYQGGRRPQLFVLNLGATPTLCLCSSASLRGGSTISSGSLGTTAPGQSTPIVSGLATPPLFAVASLGGAATMVYYDGTHIQRYQSPDNVTWSQLTQITLPTMFTPGSIIGVALTSFGTGLHLAVATQNGVWVGPLTPAFAPTQIATLPTCNWVSLTTNQNRSMLIASTDLGLLFVSTDGTNWLQSWPPYTSVGTFGGIGSYTSGLVVVPYFFASPAPPATPTSWTLNCYYGVC